MRTGQSIGQFVVPFGRRNRPQLFDRLWAEQKGRCLYCEKRMSRQDKHRRAAKFAATFEHIVPLSKGGARGSENLALACRGCNEKRGNSDARLFMLEAAGMLA